MAKRSEGGLAIAIEEAPVKAAREDKRLNLFVSAGLFEDVTNLAKEKRTTITEIVRLALGLIKVAIHETNQGNKLVVTRANGEVIKELILPG